MAWTLKRLVISAFVIVHLSAVTIWNLPACPIRERTWSWTPYYMMPTGNWQYWGMFAPEPVKATAALEGLATDRHGLLHGFAFPKMSDKSPLRAILGYRHAKYTANLSLPSYKVQREITARHVARNLGLTADDFPVHVQLMYQLRATPPPGQPPLDPMVPSVPVLIENYRFATLEDALP